MSSGVHLLLVVSTIIVAGVAWMIVGLTPATVLSVASAVIGVLLYVRRLGFAAASASEASDPTGGNDVG